MDKFVKGENEMWKMPEKERIQTRIVAASAVKSAGLLASTFGLPRHSLEDVQAKRNTHRLLRSNQMWQNISGENLRLLNSKVLSLF